MRIAANAWRIITRHRMAVIAILVVVCLLAPQPAKSQVGFLGGLIGIVTSGLGTLNNVMGSVDSALNNVIGPILRGINSVMTAAQQIMGEIFDFQRNVVYPQQAISNAQALVGRVQGIYAAIQGIWNIAVRSATLPNPRQLEGVILSRDPAQIGAVGGNFSAVYTPLPAATDVHPAERDLIDSTDAVAQAAMKRSISIDAIADQELAAANQMMSALKTTAPGTAEMVGAQAGAWLVRSQAYTQQAMAELMRVRSMELASRSARIKEGAQYARETRDKLTQWGR